MRQDPLSDFEKSIKTSLINKQNGVVYNQGSELRNVDTEVGNQYDDFVSQDAGLLHGMDQNVNRARNTDFKVLKALARLPRNIVGEAFTTVGSLAALPDLADTLSGNEVEINPVANMFMKVGETLSQGDEGRIFSLYTEDSGIFDPGNADWWAKTIEGWGPTFGMMVGSLGTGTVVKGTGALVRKGITKAVNRGIRKGIDDVLTAGRIDPTKVTNKITREALEEVDGFTYVTKKGKTRKLSGAARQSKLNTARKEAEQRLIKDLQSRKRQLEAFSKDYLKDLEKGDQFVQAASSALVSRNAEALAESKDTYDIVYQRSLEQYPGDEERAKAEASKAASQNYRYGMSLALIDAAQYFRVLSMFKGASAILPMKNKVMSALKTITVDAGGEGLEEALQYAISKNAQEANQLYQEESVMETFFEAMGDEQFQESFVQGAIGGLVFNSPGYVYSFLKNRKEKDSTTEKVEAVVNNKDVRDTLRRSEAPEDRELAQTADESEEQGDTPEVTKAKVENKELEGHAKVHQENINNMLGALSKSQSHKAFVPFIAATLELEAAKQLPEDTEAQKQAKAALVEQYEEVLKKATTNKEGETDSTKTLSSVKGIPNKTAIANAYKSKLAAEQRMMVNNDAIVSAETTVEGEDTSVDTFEALEGSSVEDYVYTPPSNSEIPVNTEIQSALGLTTQEMEDFMLRAAHSILMRDPKPEDRPIINQISKMLGGETKPISAKKGMAATEQLVGGRPGPKDGRIKQAYRVQKANFLTEARQLIKNLRDNQAETTSSNPATEHQLAKMSLQELETAHSKAVEAGGDADLFLNEIFNRANMPGERSIEAIRLFNKLNGQLEAHESMVSFLQSIDNKGSELFNLLTDLIDSIGVDMKFVFSPVGKRGQYDPETNTLYLNSKTLREEARSIFDNKKHANYSLVGDVKSRGEFVNKYFVNAALRSLMNYHIANNSKVTEDARVNEIYESIEPTLKEKYGIENIKGFLLNLTNESFARELAKDKAPLTNYSLLNKLMEVIDAITKVIFGKSENPYTQSLVAITSAMTGIEVTDITNAPRQTRSEAKEKALIEKGKKKNKSSQHVQLITAPIKFATITGDSVKIQGVKKPMPLEEFNKQYNHVLSSINKNGSESVYMLNKDNTPVLNEDFFEKYDIDIDYYKSLEIKKGDSLTLAIDADEMSKFTTANGKVVNYDMPVIKVKHNGTTIGILTGGSYDKDVNAVLASLRKQFLDRAVTNPDFTHEVEVRNVAGQDFVQTQNELPLSQAIPFSQEPKLAVINTATKGKGFVNRNTIKIGNKAIKGQQLAEQTGNVAVIVKDKSGREVFFIANTPSVKSSPETKQAIYNALLGDIDSKELQKHVKWSKDVEVAGNKKKRLPEPDLDNFAKVTYTRKVGPLGDKMGQHIVLDDAGIQQVLNQWSAKPKDMSKEDWSDMRSKLSDDMTAAYSDSRIFKIVKKGDSLMFQPVNDKLEPLGNSVTLSEAELQSAFLHYADAIVTENNILDRPIQVDRDTATYEDYKDILTTNLLPNQLFTPAQIFFDSGVFEEVQQEPEVEMDEDGILGMDMDDAAFDEAVGNFIAEKSDKTKQSADSFLTMSDRELHLFEMKLHQYFTDLNSDYVKEFSPPFTDLTIEALQKFAPAVFEAGYTVDKTIYPLQDAIDDMKNAVKEGKALSFEQQLILTQLGTLTELKFPEHFTEGKFAEYSVGETVYDKETGEKFTITSSEGLGGFDVIASSETESGIELLKENITRTPASKKDSSQLNLFPSKKVKLDKALSKPQEGNVTEGTQGLMDFFTLEPEEDADINCKNTD